MTSPKPAVEQAADLLLFAPIGFVTEVRKLLPSLAERGRAQVQMARMIGQFAVKQGQVEATKRVGQAAELVGELGLSPRRPAPAAPARPQPAPVPAAPAKAAKPARATKAAKAAKPATATQPATPRVADSVDAKLAIADYDSLAASQVVPRLAGLDDGQLEAVRRYETAHRGRKTILGKVAQLQGA